MESKESHSLSLKVLRLSRPSLAQQQPLPISSYVDAKASRVIPQHTKDETFILTPLLTLPLSFGSAYVGETFDCTLCLNNELAEGANRTVTSVKLTAEMQTPSQNISLLAGDEDQQAAQNGLSHGESLQNIVHFDLKEEGAHTLAVRVSYNESIHSGGEQAVSGGRLRNFRKLYQFNASPCISVRTKASELSRMRDEKGHDHYILEAQLENLADGVLSLEKLAFEAHPPFTSVSLNWDAEHLERPTLMPREVTQVAFLVNEEAVPENVPVRELTRDGRTMLGVLTIHWRSEMGQAGVLSTGWLTTRKR